MLEICPHDPFHCFDHDAPRCMRLIDPGTHRQLASLAHQLDPQRVASHWAASHVQADCEPTPQAEALLHTEAVGLLEHIKTSSLGSLAGWWLGMGDRWRDSGSALGEVLSSSPLLAEALVDVLAEARASVSQVLEARACLGRLTHLRSQLMACAFGQRGASGEAELEPRTLSFHGLVGCSAPMNKLRGEIHRASRGRDTVLIQGETGTGKELVARALHLESGAPADRCIVVNCAAMPRELIESELFGHRRGAFTGAITHRTGLVRAASGGTLFLDEIGELSLEAQAKLLRLIQERAVRALGDVREEPVNVRIVAATNHDLTHLLNEGKLRRDLYYRLQRLVIRVPPLRDRRQDIPLLVEQFIRRWQSCYDTSLPKVFTAAALQRLQMHDYPGNVRELENIVFAACCNAHGPTVTLSSLPALEPLFDDVSPSAPVSLRQAERQTIAEALRRANGNKSLASRVLGISRKQLYVKLRQYDLEAV